MRTLLTLLATIGVTASALAQGLVDFRNNVAFATPGDRLVRCSCDCAPISLGCAKIPSWSARLRGATLLWNAGHAGEQPDTSSITARPISVVDHREPGTWSGGPMRTLRGILPGQTATLQVRVWDITRFPTYALSECLGQWGRSSLFDYTVPPDGSRVKPTSWRISGVLPLHIRLLGPAPGMVNFNNNVPFVTRADRLVRDGLGAPLVGTNFVAQLYHGPPPTACAPIPMRPQHSPPNDHRTRNLV